MWGILSPRYYIGISLCFRFFGWVDSGNGISISVIDEKKETKKNKIDGSRSFHASRKWWEGSSNIDSEIIAGARNWRTQL